MIYKCLVIVRYMKQEKVLVFDYDGTIVNSFKAYATRFKKVARLYGLSGTTTFFRSLYLGNFARSLQDKGLTQQQVVQLIGAIRAPFIGKPALIRPFAGMVDVVNKLSEQYSVYVVSSNMSDSIVESLAYWRIKGVIRVLGGDRVFSKVEKLASLKKRHPHATFFYIGDTAGDVQEARIAGYTSVAVSWGYHSARQLEQEHPDFLATNVRTLHELFL